MQSIDFKTAAIYQKYSVSKADVANNIEKFR